MTEPSPKPDPRVARMIATAQAAGLSAFRVVWRGREVALEVAASDERDADEIAARIDRMVARAE